MNPTTDTKVSNSRLALRSSSGALFLSACPRSLAEALAVSVCSRVGRGGCGYCRYFLVAEKSFLVEEGGTSKVSGIGPAMLGCPASVVSAQIQMH